MHTSAPWTYLSKVTEDNPSGGELVAPYVSKSPRVLRDDLEVLTPGKTLVLLLKVAEIASCLLTSQSLLFHT